MISWGRLTSVMKKEWRLIIGDPAILAMSVAVPLMQVILFSYAVNTNPKHLPTAVLNFDQSEMSRSYLNAVEQTDYFDFVEVEYYESAMDQLLKGFLQFVIVIPPDFSKDVKAGRKPSMVIEADATDPVATRGAMATLEALHMQYFGHTDMRSNLVQHAKYNPSGITRYYIIPGLIGVVLLFTLCMLTAVSVVKEKVVGTMEILLTSPIRPLELMLGKIMPYVVIGYIQLLVILAIGCFQLNVPFQGSVPLLLIASFPYIMANLLMGVLFSILAKNELQAIIATTFYMLPSILLSGFFFPFQGMPLWAQWIGMALPLTHYNYITKGVMLKGIDASMVLYHSIPILIFIAILSLIAMTKFQKTLD